MITGALSGAGLGKEAVFMVKLWRLRTLTLVLILLVSLSGAARGVEPDGQVVEISSYEELLSMRENPSGVYRLTESIDMAGRAWEPLDFSGELDGGGHALLNLEVTAVGETIATTYDGNYKTYDTAFAGLFGTLTGASVHDLSLWNLRVTVDSDMPCFIGAVAGYTEDSRIANCTVQGTLELTAHDRMFGVGGFVGYGSGTLESCQGDFTLICTDTDAQTRDEQFMGGAYAAGHLNAKDCTVAIDGYDSDHGYVHNGGLVGMYIFYPAGLDFHGEITNNTVTGQITFFEDNTNRRAYCNGFIGEIMNWDFTNGGNTDDFTRNEVFDYSVNLRPHACMDPSYTESVTPAGCDTFGYTTRTCSVCGYSERDAYTLFQHQWGTWTEALAPTVQQAGREEAACILCGAAESREVPPLPPPEPSVPAPEPAEEARGESWVPLAAGGLFAVTAVVVLIVRRKKIR